MYFLNHNSIIINQQYQHKDIYFIGRKPVLEAIKDGKSIEKIYLERSIHGEFEIEIRKLAKAKEIPLSKVEVEKLNNLSKTKNHQGIVAFGSLIEYQSIEDLVPYFYENGITPRLLLLDAIEDVRNFAAISRSALWYGFNAIVVGMKNAAPVNAVGIKISAGALAKMPVCREKSLVNALSFLKTSGFKLIGADTEGTSSSIKVEGPVVLIVGSEENGINRKILSMCDEIYSIPGSGRMESLNVSVAAAIMMHEVYKESPAD